MITPADDRFPALLGYGDGDFNVMKSPLSLINRRNNAEASYIISFPIEYVKWDSCSVDCPDKQGTAPISSSFER